MLLEMFMGIWLGDWINKGGVVMLLAGYCQNPDCKWSKICSKLKGDFGYITRCHECGYGFASMPPPGVTATHTYIDFNDDD